jgi:hypothetical protein
MKRIIIGVGLDSRAGAHRAGPRLGQALQGPSRPAARVKFDTRVAQDKIKAVKRFYFFDLPLTCERSPRHVSISNRPPPNFPFPTMKVQAREFHGHFSNSDFHTRGHVEAKFNGKFTKAAGTLRVQGHPFGAQKPVRHGYRRLARATDWLAARSPIEPPAPASVHRGLRRTG